MYAMSPPAETTPDESSPLLENGSTQTHQAVTSAKPPSTPSKWRHSSQMAAAMLSFAVLGIFTSSVGVMVPYLQDEFHLDEVQVSLAFIIPPVGYVLAAQLNNLVHLHFGQRGIAIIGPLGHLICTAAICIRPSFEVYLSALTVAAVGNALLDSAWSSWAATMQNANSMSGLLHGSFSLGAGLGPFLAASILSARHAPWYYWYFILTFAALLEITVLTAAFWPQDAKVYRAKHQSDTNDTSHGFTTWRLCFSSTACWLCAVYLLLYVGTETTISDWAVTFMLRARHASPRLSASASSGFWAAMAAGRLVLGPVTDRIGLKRANLIYLSGVMAITALLTFAAHDVAACVLFTGLGFFFGPLFPSSIVLLSSKLPSHMHIPAVSFVSSVGQIGAALLPFGVGAMIKTFGILVFTYMLFIQLAATTVVWIAS